MKSPESGESGRGNKLLHVLAWPVYLGIWTVFHFIDFSMRDPGSLLEGGMSDTAFRFFYLVGVSNFVVMVIMGTESLSSWFLRTLVVVAQFGFCLAVTTYLMLYYAIGILGDTL